MPSPTDKTKDVLEQILAQLYAEQAKETTAQDGSYLIAQDGQYLGKLTDSQYDTDSILNQYGPYGSPYSTTSIFNPYSPYGSEYGSYSINNPYCTTPPKLFINGRLLGLITANRYVTGRIAPEAFLHSLKNDLRSLLAGRIIESESHARQLKHESYIEATDGTFLGKLNPNRFDRDSIFNQFGPYGNKFSQTSIFNKFSNYGSQFSNLSPYNKFTQTPPKVYVNGKFVGYLTVNQYLSPRIDPEELLQWAEQNVNRYG
jgi:glutaredoxin-related protein